MTLPSDGPPQEPKVCRLTAGGEWIRNSSSASDERRFEGQATVGRGDVIEPLPALGSLGREIELPRGNSTHRRSPPNEAAPPGSRRPTASATRARSPPRSISIGRYPNSSRARFGSAKMNGNNGWRAGHHVSTPSVPCAPKAGIGRSSRRAYEWYLAEVKPERLIS